MANGMDFQSIYREHAYEVYRDAFEELRDAEQTRECVYQVFSRIRAEGLTDPDVIRAKIPEYRAAYVAQIKTARLDVDQVWYRIRNDELTERTEQKGSMPSFRDRLRDEARKTREAAVRQAELTGTAAEREAAAGPAESEAFEEPAVSAEPAAPAEPAVPAEPDISPDPEPVVTPELLEETSIHADPGVELTPIADEAAEEPAASEEVSGEPYTAETTSEIAEEQGLPAETGPAEEPGMPAEPEAAEDAEIAVEEFEEEQVRRGSKVYWVIFVIVLAIFLWVLADILMYKGILPGFDLGYSWFNEHLFPLFPYA